MVVTPRAALVPGTTLSLTVTAFAVDTDASWTIVEADDAAPTLGAATIVQHVDAPVFAPPLPPLPGPGQLLTIDLDGIVDDGGVTLLEVVAVDGTVLGVSAATGEDLDRLTAALPGPLSDDACVNVSVLDAAGQRSAPRSACIADTASLPRSSSSSCASSRLGAPLTLLALALLFRRRSALAACVVLMGASSACTDETTSSAVCGDDFDDHSVAVTAFDDAFFEAHARPQFDFVAVKVLVLRPGSDDVVVAALDSDFFPLHDTWFSWRLLHGQRVCGAEDIAPLDPPLTVTTWNDAETWARAQPRLPPFLTFVDDGERLYAPEFYRRAREVDPRVYVPAYLRRLIDVVGDDVETDEDNHTWAIRVGSNTDMDASDGAALIDAVLPFVPSSHRLVWVPSAFSDTQRAAGLTLQSTSTYAPYVVQPNAPAG